jgi:hypothetical protein
MTLQALELDSTRSCHVQVMLHAMMKGTKLRKQRLQTRCLSTTRHDCGLGECVSRRWKCSPGQGVTRLVGPQAATSTHTCNKPELRRSGYCFSSILKPLHKSTNTHTSDDVSFSKSRTSKSSTLDNKRCRDASCETRDSVDASFDASVFKMQAMMWWQMKHCCWKVTVQPQRDMASHTARASWILKDCYEGFFGCNLRGRVPLRFAAQCDLHKSRHLQQIKSAPIVGAGAHHGCTNNIVKRHVFLLHQSEYAQAFARVLRSGRGVMQGTEEQVTRHTSARGVHTVTRSYTSYTQHELSHFAHASIIEEKVITSGLTPARARHEHMEAQ